MRPRVSVVMPAFNAEASLSSAAESVLGQSLGDLELLIIDDGSADATREIAESLARSDGRVRLVSQKNAGPAAARNVGLDRARGEYVAFLDADDRWLGHAMETLVEGASRAPSGAAFARFEFADARGAVTDLQPGGYDGTIGMAELLEDLHFPIHTWTVRREVLGDLRFDRSLLSWEDLDLYQRLALRGVRFAPVPVVMARYCLSPTSQSRRCLPGVAGRTKVLQRGYLAARALGWDRRDPFHASGPAIDLSEARLGADLARQCHAYAAMSLLSDPTPEKSRALDMLRFCPLRYRASLRISAREAAIAACRHMPYSKGRLTDSWVTDHDVYLPHALAWWERLARLGYAGADLAERALGELPGQVDATANVARLLVDACPQGRPVILHGMGKNGKRVARELARRGRAFVACDDRISQRQIELEMPGAPVEMREFGVAAGLDGFHIVSMLEDESYVSRLARGVNAVRWSRTAKDEGERVRAMLAGRFGRYRVAA